MELEAGEVEKRERSQVREVEVIKVTGHCPALEAEFVNLGEFGEERFLGIVISSEGGR